MFKLGDVGIILALIGIMIIALISIIIAFYYHILLGLFVVALWLFLLSESILKECI